MFKSIFSKLLATNLFIAVSLIIVISFVFSLVYSIKLFDDKQKQLSSAAFKSNQLANRYSRGEIDQDELTRGLDNVGFVTDSKIYVVRLKKTDIGSIEKFVPVSEINNRYIVEDLAKILEGAEVVRKRQYSAALDAQVLFYGSPWEDGGDISGAILLFSPVNNIAKSIARINLTVFITGFILLALSAFLIYRNSRKISAPIIKMQQSAVLLASGAATEDVVVEGRDEVGRLAEAFNNMKSQLSATERMRREFIANVSHDLRTPLTSINGLVEGMLEGIVKPEDYNKYLSIIHKETNRLNRLTGDILQLARLQAGNQTHGTRPERSGKLFTVGLYPDLRGRRAHECRRGVRARLHERSGAVGRGPPQSGELGVHVDGLRGRVRGRGVHEVAVAMMAPLLKYGVFGSEVSLVFAFLIGLGFGFALERAGFGSARKLVSQFYLDDMAVFKVMFT
ncbi:MAG: HAMP domain-containing histidine kinase, partial [Clostridiales bacterium]|nr:HAMP domain-containing histidine kinase [Clostridiales bacterium]